MSKSLFIASGRCNTCNQRLEHVGSTEEDAKMLLMHEHGGKKHIFHGHITTRNCSEEEARNIERRRIP